MHTQMTGEMQQCIDECLACSRICLATVVHCLRTGGRHAEPSHIGLLLDCAEICQTSANFLLRHSHHHRAACGACAVVCAACAESCAQLAGDTEMQRCADECAQCADSCRAMAH